MDDLLHQLLGGLGTVLGGAEQTFGCAACGRFTQPNHAWLSVAKKRVVCDDCIEGLFDEDEELPWDQTAEEVAEQSDHWTLLGLDPKTATKEGVNQAYRELARDFHPDRHPEGEAAMKELNKARAAALEELSHDEETR